MMFHDSSGAVILSGMRDYDDDDWENPDPDEADDDAPDLVASPSCGEAIYEDAEQCSHCGDYVVHSTSALAGRSFWFSLIGIIGVVAAVAYWSL